MPTEEPRREPIEAPEEFTRTKPITTPIDM